MKSEKSMCSLNYWILHFSLFTFHLTSLFTLKINCYGECYYEACG
nr:MAG TPA: hypothetical protein [Caudoviricetes sp.]